jgi:hypothetical protein
MDYTKQEKEFDANHEKPLWMRPIALSELAKKNKIPLSIIRVSFDDFWSQRIRENQQNKG